MQINVEHSDHGKMILQVSSGERTAVANLDSSLLPMIAIGLATGKGTIVEPNFTLENGRIEIMSGSGTFSAEESPHRRLQLAMKIWLNCHLDEESFRKITDYPALQLETDSQLKKHIRVKHAGQMNDHVAIIPEIHIFTVMTRQLDDTSVGQFENSGVEILIKRSGPVFEIETRAKEGDFIWVATPKEIAEIQSKYGPAQTTRPPNMSAPGAPSTPGTQPNIQKRP